MWDLGGQERIRRLWRHYYEGIYFFLSLQESFSTLDRFVLLIFFPFSLSGNDGLVFVVDSNDRNRLQEAAKSLQGVLSEDALANCSGRLAWTSLFILLLLLLIFFFSLFWSALLTCSAYLCEQARHERLRIHL
jgi:GTPase SAR1 family protein